MLRPLRRRLGFQPFGAQRLGRREQAGDQVIEPHRERERDGRALRRACAARRDFTLGEETFDAPAGTLVHAPPGTFR